jgi:hypothetical protein
MSSYYTAKTGSDSNSGASIDAAFLTVTKGVSVLAAGDTLFVRTGAYDEALINNVPSGASWTNKVRIAAYNGELVSLAPSFGPEYVVLFSGNQQYVEFDGISMDGTTAIYGAVKIEGWANANPHHIRMQNAEVKASLARDTQGIVLDAQKAGIIGGNEFINVKIHAVGGLDFSHGIYIKSSDNLVEKCDIYDFPGGGVHIYNASYPMNGNIVRGNVVHDGRRTAAGQRHWGIIVADGAVGNQVYNNVVYGIPTEGASSAGIITLYNQRDTAIYNNTVYGNAGKGIEIAHVSATGTSVKNNISYNNAGGDFSDLGTGTVQQTNLFGTDPQFVNPASHDFKLQAASPARNTGTTLSSVATDIDGVTRPQESIYDIGAYEYKTTGTEPVPPPELSVPVLKLLLWSVIVGVGLTLGYRLTMLIFDALK